MSDFSTLDLLIENMDSSLDGPLSSREVECVAKGWRQGEATANAELTRLQAENEALRARVAQLETAALNAVQLMPGGQAKADLRDAYDAEESAEAWLLRKQSWAVEDFLDWANGYCSGWAQDDAGRIYWHDAQIKGFAQRLHQQADEAEREGGERGSL